MVIAACWGCSDYLSLLTKEKIIYMGTKSLVQNIRVIRQAKVMRRGGGWGSYVSRIHSDTVFFSHMPNEMALCLPSLCSLCALLSFRTTSRLVNIRAAQIMLHKTCITTWMHQKGKVRVLTSLRTWELSWDRF